MIEFLSLHLKNFLPFKDTTVSFLNNCITRIRGVELRDNSAQGNGAGKSSFPEGLCWCLFGKTTRGENYSSVVHSNVQNDCCVETVFKSLDRTYKVQRFRDDTNYKNQLRLYELADGEFVWTKEINPQDTIIKLIGDTFESFSVRTIFSKRSIKITEPKNLTELKEILRKYANISRFEDVYQYCKTGAKKIQDELVIKNKDMEILNLKNNQIWDQYWFHLRSDQRWEFERDMKVYALQEEIDKNKKELEELKKNYADACPPKADDVNQRLKELKEDKQLLTKRYNELKKNEVDVLVNLKSNINSIESQLTRINNDIKKIESLTDSTCPTCKQTLGKRAAFGIISGYEQNKSRLTTELADAQRKYEIFQESSSQQHQQMDKQLVDIEYVIIANEHEKEIIVKESYRLGQLSTAIENKEHSISKKEKEAELLRKSCPNHWADAISIKRDARKIWKDIIKTQAEIQVMTIELEALLFWKDACHIHNLQNEVLTTIIPELNHWANYYGTKISSGNLEINFSTTKQLKKGMKDEFNIILRYDKAFSYDAMSDSQQTKTNIAIALALARVRPQHNLLIFDEIFDTLDEVSLKTVVELIRELSINKHLFIITHEDWLKDFFPDEWVVTRDREGFSSIA